MKNQPGRNKVNTTIVNAISLNMLPLDTATERFTLSVERVTIEDAARFLRAAATIENKIGHPTTDAVVREMLAPFGVNPSPGERGQIDWMRWVNGWPILVAQYVGPRLPEGATVLPEGASIVWLLVGCRSGQYHCPTCNSYTGRECSPMLETELRLAAR